MEPVERDNIFFSPYNTEFNPLKILDLYPVPKWKKHDLKEKILLKKVKSDWNLTEINHKWGTCMMNTWYH